MKDLHAPPNPARSRLQLCFGEYEQSVLLGEWESILSSFPDVLQQARSDCLLNPGGVTAQLFPDGLESDPPPSGVYLSCLHYILGQKAVGLLLTGDLRDRLTAIVRRVSLGFGRAFSPEHLVELAEELHLPALEEQNPFSVLRGLAHFESRGDQFRRDDLRECQDTAKLVNKTIDNHFRRIISRSRRRGAVTLDKDFASPENGCDAERIDILDLLDVYMEGLCVRDRHLYIKVKSGETSVAAEARRRGVPSQVLYRHFAKIDDHVRRNARKDGLLP